MHTTNTNSFVNVSEIKSKIAGQLFDDTQQVSGKTKLLDGKRKQSPITEVNERTKSSNFRLLVYVCDFETFYIYDTTNGKNQSPSLKKFIGTTFISIRKPQRKLRQVTSGV